MKKETFEETNRRQQLIISEPNGIVRETMIANLLIDIEERSYSKEEVDLLNKMFNIYWYENNNEHEDNLEEWNLSKKLFEQFK